ncbi:MAG: hypothetical protein AAGF66_17185 [Cyanobacteria bacterium P01_H01_bin.119]
MGKWILGIATAVVGVLATGLYYTESYFSLYPSVDTVLPPNFIQKFPHVSLGMTTDEIESLLGEPTSAFQRDTAVVYREEFDEIFQQTPGVIASCWQYGSDGAAKFWDFAWLSYSVCFDSDDQVIQTGVKVYYD